MKKIFFLFFSLIFLNAHYLTNHFCGNCGGHTDGKFVIFDLGEPVSSFNGYGYFYLYDGHAYGRHYKYVAPFYKSVRLVYDCVSHYVPTTIIDDTPVWVIDDDLFNYCDPSKHSGMTWSEIKHIWVDDSGSVSCPPGQFFDNSTNSCKDIPVCPAYSDFSAKTGKCVSTDDACEYAKNMGLSSSDVDYICNNCSFGEKVQQITVNGKTSCYRGLHCTDGVIPIAVTCQSEQPITCGENQTPDYDVENDRIICSDIKSSLKSDTNFTDNADINSTDNTDINSTDKTDTSSTDKTDTSSTDKTDTSSTDKTDTNSTDKTDTSSAGGTTINSDNNNNVNSNDNNLNLDNTTLQNIYNQAYNIYNINKEIKQHLINSNSKLDNISGSLKNSNNKLDNISGALKDSNNKLDNISDTLKDSNNKLGDISDTLKDGNNKLDKITDILSDNNGTIKNDVTGALSNAKKYIKIEKKEYVTGSSNDEFPTIQVNIFGKDIVLLDDSYRNLIPFDLIKAILYIIAGVLAVVAHLVSF
jgi:hypothetical protein